MGERQIWQVACFHFQQWKGNPRVRLVFFLALVLSLFLSDDTISVARSYGTTVQVVEPFVWAFGSGEAIMLSSMLLLLLFADLPVLNEAVPYYLCRVCRKVWILGEMVYIVLASALYCATLLCGTSLFCANLAFGGNVWSSTGALLGYSGLGVRKALPASVKAMEMSTPYACALCVFVLVLLYALLNVTWMQMFRIRFGTAPGIVGVLLLNLAGMLLEPRVFLQIPGVAGLPVYQANLIAGWVSPLNHAIYSMHNFGYDYLPRLWMSMGIFVLLITGNGMVIYMEMRRYSFSFSQTKG